MRRLWRRLRWWWIENVTSWPFIDWSKGTRGPVVRRPDDKPEK